MDIARIAERILGVHVDVLSGAQEGYRNRMDLVCFPGGFGMRSAYDRFVPERSELASDAVNDLVAQVRSCGAHEGSRYVVVRALDTSSVSFVDGDRARIEDFARSTSADNVILTHAGSDTSTSSEYEVIKGSDLLRASINGVELLVHVQGFFQNNLEMAEAMHEYISQGLRGHELIDLYGGVGAFACSLGSFFKRSIVIESHIPSARIAKINMERNGIEGSVIAGDASRASFSEFSTVILDPPRAGSSPSVMRQLALARPERIVYVSCNPRILPRDLAYLRSYSIVRAAAIDMFPRTDHFELVTVLERSVT